MEPHAPATAHMAPVGGPDLVGRIKQAGAQLQPEQFVAAVAAAHRPGEVAARRVLADTKTVLPVARIRCV